MRWNFIFIFLFIYFHSSAQKDTADLIKLGKETVLSEVVIRSDLDIVKFLQRVREDTTFYKAFRNLHVIGFTSLNDIKMLDKDGKVKASLYSKTKQSINNSCRTMEVLDEKSTGDIYNGKELNYYTAELYSGLFFTNGRVCGETNIVKGTERNVSGKSGIEKHKEQLKMLFFDPGKKIPGIPFIGNKISIFDPAIAKYYDFSIDMTDYNGEDCYVFTIKTKNDLSSDRKDNIVIDNMTTWFNSRSMEIVGRNYDLSYDAGVYDFNVSMEVQMTHVGKQLVPKLLRYNGNWNVAFNKREKGIFTATLFDFRTHE